VIEFLTVVKRVLSWVPNAVTAPMIATAIRPTSSAYSTAVAPSWFAMRVWIFAYIFVIVLHLFFEEVVSIGTIETQVTYVTTVTLLTQALQDPISPICSIFAVVSAVIARKWADSWLLRPKRETHRGRGNQVRTLLDALRQLEGKRA